MMCNADGGVLDDLVVYRLAEKKFLVVANAGNVAVVLAELLKRTGSFDVEVTDRSAADRDARATAQLHGPDRGRRPGEGPLEVGQSQWRVDLVRPGRVPLCDSVVSAPHERDGIAELHALADAVTTSRARRPGLSSVRPGS